MRVKAKCWIKHGDDWHKAGDVFDADKFDAEIMTLVDEPVDEVHESAEAGTEQPKRGRRRKTEE